MPQIRATRLEKGEGRAETWLSPYLPYGTRRRKIALWAGLPLAILLVLYFIMDNIVMMQVTRHGEEFTLPNFEGQTMIEASVTLDNLGLSGEVASYEFAPGTPKGVIINQFPRAATKVKDGRRIKFVVSAGQKMITIPSLAGESVRQAMLDLETAGLKLGEIAWAFSDTLPERVVVFSYPAAGTEIPLGAPVNLMVNRGRASSFTYVPHVVGLTLAEAQKRIEDKNLRVGVVTYKKDDAYLPETVLEQSDPPGAELDIHTEIDLVVSKTD
ncbi:MAG TPA: PASTA domain-containing protein [candidate division Zixibacteria bacterium]|nr:PASTA domain-containing protein [candidate division Zixibacteria bacterium]